MNKQSNLYIQINKALAKHKADTKKVDMFSPAYYYAQTMIERCEAALKIKDESAAWKYFAG